MFIIITTIVLTHFYYHHHYRRSHRHHHRNYHYYYTLISLNKIFFHGIRLPYNKEEKCYAIVPLYAIISLDPTAVSVNVSANTVGRHYLQ